MTATDDSNVGTSEVRSGYSFDVASLTNWMTCHVQGFAGPMKVQQFKGGQSNPTYKLITAAQSYVLRRKPSGQLLKGAHAIDREARILRGLGEVGFPVPHVFGLCTDEAVIGTQFFVMEMVEGRIFWDATVPGVSSTERALLYDEMNKIIAELHCIDQSTIGLADFGRSGLYFERQVARWSQQYFADAEAGRNADMDRLIDWLRSNMPADDDAVAITHGDFRIDNIIFHPSEPRILAVLDWELSTLGHPGADFAYHAMMYRMPPHIVAGLGGASLINTGIPTEADYLAAYCARTGRDGMANYGYYMAFNFFRLAAIFHGIKGRVLRGTAASAQAKQRVAVLPELFALAWQQAEACD